MRSPARSAVPLASVGIICLGLVPTLGGPDLPLHWAMTAAMTGFGVLMLVRHRLLRREPPLADVPAAQARTAGRAILWVSGICTLFVVGIVVLRLLAKGPIAPLSLLMPAAGLVWLTSLGLKALRHPSAEPQETPSDRPSRRPPSAGPSRPARA